jgi:hypothetical protein
VTNSAEDLYPWIPWRTPLCASPLDGAALWVCRLCVADHGLRAQDVDLVWPTADAVARHLATAHALMAEERSTDG